MSGYYDNGKGCVRRGIGDKAAEDRFRQNFDEIDWGAHRRQDAAKQAAAKRRRRKP